MSLSTVLLFIMYMCLFLFGISGNLLIIIYFGWKLRKNRNRNYHIFIVHLACVDFLCCLIVPGLKLTNIIQSGFWAEMNFYYGKLHCKYVQSIGWLTVGVSAWILVGINYERHQAIEHPLKKRLRLVYIVVYFVFCWIILLPFVFYSSEALTPSVNEGCVVRHDSSYYIYLPVLVVLENLFRCIIPITLMLLYLLRINNTLKFSKTRHEIYRGQRERNKKVLRVLWVTTGAYIFSTSFGHTVSIFVELDNRYKIFDLKNYVHIFQWCFSLFYLNSIMNCFIYAGGYQDFRRFVFQCFSFKRS